MNMQADSLGGPASEQTPNASKPRGLARGLLRGLGQRQWRFLVLPMLLLLHVAVLRGVTDSWARSLLLAHFGLVLLWQPFLRGQQSVTIAQAVFIAVFAAAVTLFLSWWLLAFWVVVLAGLVGGKVYRQHARWERGSYLALLGYLLALLVIVILPAIAPRNEISAEVRRVAEYGLPLLVLIACLLPTVQTPEEEPEVIDLFYSVFLMLLLGVIVLGSFTFMTLGSTSYLEAMIYTLFAIAGTVLVIALTWSPRAGFAGISVFFVRYLLSISLPLEQWLFFLSELSRREESPERFLGEAVARLLRLPWVAGAEWKAADEHGQAGERSGDSVPYERPEIALTIYSRFRISPALHWHLKLIAQLLGEFYVAKLREQAFREQSYLQAVHETGARVTHDVKNLLQSLNVLCSVVANADRSSSPQTQALVRRQLPVLAQRLSATLERLQRPVDTSNITEDAQRWWRALAAQYERSDVEFELQGECEGRLLPRALFDSVADNLLQNALAKRVLERSLRIKVALACRGDGAQLSVTDSGEAIPADVARMLLRAPVRSQRGLGIGLYQAARQAEAAGYRLRVDANRDGEVSFSLAPAVAAPGVDKQADNRDQGNTPAEISRP